MKKTSRFSDAHVGPKPDRAVSAGKGKTYKTATGATQWTRDLNAQGQSAKTIRNLKDRVTKDFTKLKDKDFKDKYGSSYTSVMARLEAANSARASQNIKEIDNGKDSATSKMYDSWEKSDVSRYNKGGYVNCGASMKPTQKSSMACGGMATKKGKK